jgi:hypothetical protein
VSENVDHHFSRPKDFVPSTVTALKSLQYHMVGLIGIVAHADRFVIQRVEWPSEALFRFDAMETQELGELLEGHLDALPELLGGCRGVAAKRALEIVNDRQQSRMKASFCVAALRSASRAVRLRKLSKSAARRR